MLLVSLAGTPLVGALFIYSTEQKKHETFSSYNQRVKNYTFIFSNITLALSLILWLTYNENNMDYQGLTYIFGLTLGIDGISLYFILLTTLTLSLAILASWNNIKHRIKFFFGLYLVLEFFLLGIFLVQDLIAFYVFFEAILIPLYLMYLITDVVVEEKKLRAANLLFLYTLTGSLFMLLSFIYIIWYNGTGNFIYLSNVGYQMENQVFVWLGIFLSIAIKTPLIPFHPWLPKAHSEAPVGVSMLLAGVVLKLAAYAAIRILIPFFPETTVLFSPYVQGICLITLIMGSLITIRQTDIKCLVAYSSICHMSIVILGLFSNDLLGLQGGYTLSLAHGLVSPALFYIVGSITYDYFGTRVLRYYRGLTQYAPLLSIFMAFFTFANIGTPLSLNFVGEFLALTGTTLNNPIVGFIATSGIVLSSIYGIWLYNRMFFGTVSPYLKCIIDISRRDFHILLPLLLFTYILGIVPNIIFEGLHLNLSSILFYDIDSPYNYIYLAGPIIIKSKEQVLQKLEEESQKPFHLHLQSFQILCNGLFQAEGFLGATFKELRSLLFMVRWSLGQNASEESIYFWANSFLILLVFVGAILSLFPLVKLLQIIDTSD